MPVTRTSLCGLTLCSPTVLASGILGLTAFSLARVARAGAGAVTLKSCGLLPRSGHPSPSILPYPGGLLNAVGLSNPGAEQVAREIVQYRGLSSTPVIASVFGATVAEFGEVTDILAGAGPDLIEVNVSCPNVASEFGTPFGANFDSAAEVTREVKRFARGIPVSVKLTVNCPDLGRMARTCVDAGAEAITAINTIGPGMWIDIDSGVPVLSNKMGGVSGPAILPIAVRAVYEIYAAVGSRVGIIGTGGVSSAEDAVQMILAGASAVGIGTAVHHRGIDVFREINRGLQAYASEKGYASLGDIRGRAHE